MIYFDGSECNAANGPYWYWVSQQPMSIYRRIRREVLAQGSSDTPWTWHVLARGACDDFAAVAPKQYLDYHKIGDCWQSYTRSFMPAELGWWGFLAAAPHQPATSPDEVELHAVRMLALDTPISLETSLSAFEQNGRTREMLQLLGDYERLRLSGTVPAAVREKLRQGEWHRVPSGGKPAFHPIRYDAQRLAVPGGVSVVNRFDAQPLRFRLEAVPAPAAPGDRANVLLVAADPPAELKLPSPAAPMPGAAATALGFLEPPARQASGAAIGARGRLAGGAGKPLDLRKHRRWR